MNRGERVGCLALASLFLLISLAPHRRLLSSEPRSSYINHVYSVENADAVILSTASRLSGITTATLFSRTLKHCASAALAEKRLTGGVARGRRGCGTAKRPIWIPVRRLRTGHSRLRPMRQGDKKRFKTPLVYLARDNK